MNDCLRAWIVNDVQVTGSLELDSLDRGKLFTREMNPIVPRVPTEFGDLASMGRLVGAHLPEMWFLQPTNAIPVHGLGIHDPLLCARAALARPEDAGQSRGGQVVHLSRTAPQTCCPHTRIVWSRYPDLPQIRRALNAGARKNRSIS